MNLDMGLEAMTKQVCKFFYFKLSVFVGESNSKNSRPWIIK